MLSISQFSKISHITTKTLRYYDEIDLLKPAYIDEENNYRYYATDQLLYVLLIQKLKSFEFSLDEIKDVISNKRDIVSLLEEKRNLINDKITAYSNVYKDIEYELISLSKGGTIMFNKNEFLVEKVKYPETLVLSVHRTINIRKDFMKLMNELTQKIEETNSKPIGAPMSIYHSPEYTPENYDVEIAIPVKDKNTETKILEAQDCAMVYHKGSYDAIPKIYAYLPIWIEENGYKINGSVFEVYLSDPNTTDPDENEITIYFPIIEKDKE